MPDRFPPKPFRCEIEDAGRGTARVVPAGELDMSTVRELETSLHDARAAGFGRIVVDLRALEFMDSTGLTLLTRWSLGAELDGYELALIPGSARIQRLFDITGLSPHFEFVDG